MEEKISVLELYFRLDNAFKELPFLCDNIYKICNIKFYKTYKYNIDLFFYIYQITIVKSDIPKIVIEYRYCKEKDNKSNKDLKNISEKIEITIDEQNNLRFRSIEIINDIEDLEHLPNSILNKPLSKLFNIEVIKRYFETLNSINSKLTFLIPVNCFSSSHKIEIIFNILSECNRFHDQDIYFIISVCNGNVLLHHEYGKPIKNHDLPITHIPSYCLEAYIGKIDRNKISDFMFHYDDTLLDLASNTYVNINDLPENIREYIRYIKNVDAENIKLKQLTNKHCGNNIFSN